MNREADPRDIFGPPNGQWWTQRMQSSRIPIAYTCFECARKQTHVPAWILTDSVHHSGTELSLLSPFDPLLVSPLGSYSQYYYSSEEHGQYG